MPFSYRDFRNTSSTHHVFIKRCMFHMFVRFWYNLMIPSSLKMSPNVFRINFWKLSHFLLPIINTLHMLYMRMKCTVLTFNLHWKFPFLYSPMHWASSTESHLEGSNTYLQREQILLDNHGLLKTEVALSTFPNDYAFFSMPSFHFLIK